jgi:serine phosphatase RsbU (regulator of sigma subunit)
MPDKPFEAYPGNEPYIFVSYSHADGDAVYAELRHLHTLGYRIWYDEGIPPSENWVGVIPNRISTCAVVLLFLSPAAVASKWVRKEISYALRLRREVPILPIYLSETDIDAELDFQLGSTQALHRHRMDVTAFRSRLDQQLRKHEGLIPIDLPPPAEELMGAAYAQLVARSPVAPAGCSCEAWFQPARTIGGDFYDSRILPDGGWLVILGDVAGKGIPAGFFAVSLLGMLDAAFSAPEIELAGAIERVNEALIYRGGTAGRFATLVALLIKPTDHSVMVVNAGHMSPQFLRASGETWELDNDQCGLPLGVIPGFAYQTVGTRLEPGDGVLLFTDGVTDAMSPAGDMFGYDGIARFTKDIQDPSGWPHQCAGRLRTAIEQYTSGRALNDDVTVLWVRRNPAPPD